MIINVKPHTIQSLQGPSSTSSKGAAKKNLSLRERKRRKRAREQEKEERFDRLVEDYKNRLFG
jgi:hypothetical protein